MTSSRAYGWAVGAKLTVATSDHTAALVAAGSALDAIRTALAALNANVELSFAEAGGQLALNSTGGAFGGEGSLLIGSDATEGAQSVAGEAKAAIDTALVGTSPAVTVALDQENGTYVLQEIG